MVGPGFTCLEYKAEQGKFIVTVFSGIYDLDYVGMGFEGDILNCTSAIASDKADPNMPDAGTKTNVWWFNASGVQINKGMRIARFEFEDACAFKNWANSDFKVYYTIRGESVVHSVDGRANLKVE